MNLIEKLKQLNGYWHYAGGRYLAKLTSGKVSDTFCNTGVLTCRTDLLKGAVHDLIFRKWSQYYPTNEAYGHNTFVCGPAMGGVTLAYEVARQLSATAIFTEPVYGLEDVDPIANDGKHMSFQGTLVKNGQQLKRFEIPESATVLFVEDVITTGKSTKKMVEAVMKQLFQRIGNEVNILPYVLCLVNRSGAQNIMAEFIEKDGSLMPPDYAGSFYSFNADIISLADVQARTWDTIEEAEADLIDPRQQYTDAMEAVRPKDNWDLLTGEIK